MNEANAVSEAQVDARARLLCLPYAGAGAGFFNAWRRRGSPLVEVIGVQLPGREDLLREPPATTIDAAVAAVLPVVEGELAKPGRVALFGHSSGSIVAFELARRLDATAPGRIARLFVSGAAAPWIGRRGQTAGLPDDEFIEAVEKIAGVRHAALAEPKLRGLVLPALRADMQMHEEYRTAFGTATAVSITSLRGSDDTLVSAAEAAEWSHATSADFDYHELPGGHMYLTDARERLLDLVGASLRESSHVPRR